MDSPEDLEAIIAKWPTQKSTPSLKIAQEYALKELYNNRRSRGSFSIPANILARKLCLSELEIGNLMEPLVNRYVRLSKNRYGADQYSLRSDALEIFENRREIYTKLILAMHKLQGYEREINLPDVARESGFGEFGVTLYYMKDLASQCLVLQREEQQYGQRKTTFKLTTKGGQLAEYLAKMKNIKSK